MHPSRRWAWASWSVVTTLCLASSVAAVDIEVRYLQALPGDDAVVDIVLHSEGAQVAGTQNDIAFGPGAPISATAKGEPDCWVNPAIDKSGTTFAFFPFGCLPRLSNDCNGIRALVLALDSSTLSRCAHRKPQWRRSSDELSRRRDSPSECESVANPHART
jgi:hypothetical protein